MLPDELRSTAGAGLPAVACNDRRVARVLRHVMQDLTMRATCASAARVAGLERAYFSKLFRSVMCVSFTEWNASVRIAEAKRLLREIDLSITAVSASVGYDDVTTCLESAVGTNLDPVAEPVPDQCRLRFGEPQLPR